MRPAPLLFAGAILALATLDFWLNTRPLLEDQERLRSRVAELHRDDRSRLERHEWQPSVEQLEEWRAAADRAERTARQVQESWFSRAEEVFDYLLPHVEDRPAAMGPGEVRDRLRRLLLAEATRLPRIASGRTRLGIDFPGATRDVPDEVRELRDQVERALLLGWTLDALREEEVLSRLELEREGDGLLRAEMEFRAPLGRLLEFLDEFLEPSVRIPPRRILWQELSVIAPESWSGSVPEGGPPLRLSLAIELERPWAPPATEGES